MKPTDPPVHSNSSPAKNLRRHVARWLSRRWRADARAPSGPLPVAGIHRILVCRATKTLGETLLLTPLLHELELRFPGAEVELVSRCAAATELFARYPRLRRVHALPQHMFGAPLRVWRILRWLRVQRFDLAIDPYLLSHSDRLLVMLARPQYSLGFDSERKHGHLTHPVALPPTPQHAAQLPVYLLRHALGVAAAAEYPLLDLRLTAAERSAGADALTALLAQAGSTRRALGVYAHASGVKCFERMWWADFLRVLQTRFPQHAIVEILPMFGRSLLGDNYPAFYASDLRQLAGVLSQLDLFVSGDCGVMHLASASGARTAGIFVATDIAGWNVYGPGRLTLDARGCAATDVAEEVALRSGV
ncbi:MAG: glycosyltransferase family 9 protein [Rudaea sp.]